MEVIIQQLIKKYDQKLIMDISHLHFKKGKIIGLLGDNGCGKSTLLNIISGLDKDYAGEILYDGYPLKHYKQHLIGMVRQKPYLFKRSVYDNVEYPLKIKKIEKNKRKQIVDDLLRDMDIDAMKNQRADTLSGGEAQKVALARMLAASPKLLLLDETTANIHEEAICTIEKQLKRYHEKMHCTIIFVTHNLTQAKRFCDECIWLD